LLHAGEILYSSGHPSYSSISPCNQNFEFAETITTKDNLVKTLRNEKYYDILSRLEYVSFIEGTASFVSDRKVKVNDNKIEADKFIIATGSSPYIPVIKGLDTVAYITNVEALSLNKKPSTMIIIGGRALGLEFAQMYSRFRTHVTLLQRSNRIIPDHEPEISEKLHEYLSSESIDIITGVEIKEAYQKNNNKIVRISTYDANERQIEAEQLLFGTGRRPNTQSLHLENTRVSLRENDGAIIVNSEMQTSGSNMWAAGDVIGEPMLESLAAKEGATAAENAINGSRKQIDFLSIPSAIFTSPQVASVGLTESQMMEKYGFCSCKTLSMNQVPKALTINRTKGLIKMVVNPKENDKILGVHILADLGADMIHEAVMAVKYKLTVDDIIDTVHVFPTMTEAIKLVATSFKQDVKKLTCCAE
ncbi:MAG TPA: mercury(II) reductase, partial [Nitrososphaeraceae archaeon]